jgi:hypothetical protein
MTPATQDRPRYDNFGHQLCNESINGTGFGDGIAGNERMGLRSFAMFQNATWAGAPEFMDDPKFAMEYYNYLKATWMDSTRMVYGGNGHEGYGGYGPEANFMFPGSSDTLNWGCGCQPPNGPVNWTEVTADNLPHDIRAIGSTGPVNFQPGEIQELDLAFVWARDYTSPDTLASVEKLRTMIDTVRKAFLSNTLPGGGSFLGIGKNELRSVSACHIYPNPATASVTIDFGGPVEQQARVDIFNASGRTMETRNIHKGCSKITVNLTAYPEGLYLFNFTGEGTHYVNKILVRNP